MEELTQTDLTGIAAQPCIYLAIYDTEYYSISLIQSTNRRRAHFTTESRASAVPLCSEPQRKEICVIKKASPGHLQTVLRRQELEPFAAVQNFSDICAPATWTAAGSSDSDSQCPLVFINL